MLGPFHVRRIEVSDRDASHEWIFEVANESGQAVLALPFEAVISTDAAESDNFQTDEVIRPGPFDAENGG